MHKCEAVSVCAHRPNIERVPEQLEAKAFDSVSLTAEVADGPAFWSGVSSVESCVQAPLIKTPCGHLMCEKIKSSQRLKREIYFWCEGLFGFFFLFALEQTVDLSAMKKTHQSELLLHCLPAFAVHLAHLPVVSSPVWERRRAGSICHGFT